MDPAEDRTREEISRRLNRRYGSVGGPKPDLLQADESLTSPPPPPSAGPPPVASSLVESMRSELEAKLGQDVQAELDRRVRAMRGVMDEVVAAASTGDLTPKRFEELAGMMERAMTGEE